MTAAPVRTTARRPVRVTIEGEAYHPDSSSDVLILVRPDGGKVVFPTNAEGVTVEDIVPPRVWTDGDVVEAPGLWIAWRERGEWWTTTQAKSGTLRSSGPFADDDKIGDMLGDGLQIVRNQAGDL